MPKIFHDFDLVNFWEDSKYARKEYVEAKPTAAMILAVEKELGFKLPASYIELMQSQNGGIPVNRCFPTNVATSWAEDHIAITGIMGIGRTKTYSLCGRLGSPFMQEEWGYPKFGICICDCPSAGHDMIMLDYRKCGKAGEPRVIHVDQEGDFRITVLAKDFETFIRGLVNESVYDTSAEDLKNSLNKIDSGAFSPLLRKLIDNFEEISFEPIIRTVCRRLTEDKGYFALHADEKSYFMYDIQFFLCTSSKSVGNVKKYIKEYEKIIALDGEFSTGGFAPDFVLDWFKQRQTEGNIVTDPDGNLVFSKPFIRQFKSRIKPYQ